MGAGGAASADGLIRPFGRAFGPVSASIRRMELQEKRPWAADNHRSGSVSARGECTWAAPCPRPAVWSVRVSDAGGDSWWAACAEHADSSPVLSPEASDQGADGAPSRGRPAGSRDSDG